MPPVPLTEQEIAELLATATDAHLCGTPMPADSALVVMRVLGELDRVNLNVLALIDWEERCAAAERARDDARDLAMWLLRDWPSPSSPATPVSVTVAEATIERWRAWGWRPADEDADQAQGGEVPSPTGTSSAGDAGASSPSAPSTAPLGGRVALAGADDPRPWAETAGAPPPAPAVHHERIPEHEVALQRDTLLATCHHLRQIADGWTLGRTVADIPWHGPVRVQVDLALQVRAILDATLDVIEDPE